MHRQRARPRQRQPERRPSTELGSVQVAMHECDDARRLGLQRSVAADPYGLLCLRVAVRSDGSQHEVVVLPQQQRVLRHGKSAAPLAEGQRQLARQAEPHDEGVCGGVELRLAAVAPRETVCDPY